MRKIKKALIHVPLIFSMLLSPVQALASMSFADVNQDDWFTPYVERAMDLGLMSGMNEETFSPHTTLNRGMAATIIYRMSGAPQWSYRDVFSDVSEGDYYGTATSFAQEKGIITGHEDGTFRPLEPVSRQDLSVMLFRWAEQYRPSSLVNQASLEGYPDQEDVALYARMAMEWAVGSTIITGSQGYLEPRNGTTRAQAAKIFSMSYDIEPVFNETPAEPDQDPGMSEELPDYVAPDQTPADPDQDGMDMPGSPDEEIEVSGPPAPPKDPVKPGDADSPELLASVQMFGIDISEHNGDIDLEPYRGQFVIIRGGYYDTVDKTFYRNIAKCEALGIPYGIYWYSYALDEEQALTEARACLKTIAGTDPKLGVWLDMEDADAWKRKHGWEINRETIGPISKAFCDEVSRAGYYTGIYTSISWQPFLEGYCDGYARWIAHWGTNNGDIHFDYSRQGVLHQYTSNPIDKNVLYIPLNLFKYH